MSVGPKTLSQPLNLDDRTRQTEIQITPPRPFMPVEQAQRFFAPKTVMVVVSNSAAHCADPFSVAVRVICEPENRARPANARYKNRRCNPVQAEGSRTMRQHSNQSFRYRDMSRSTGK